MIIKIKTHFSDMDSIINTEDRSREVENLIPQVGDEIYWISDAGRKWRGTVAHRTLILAPSILPYDMVLDITDYHTASNI
jgi:hypothetical protein